MGAAKHGSTAPQRKQCPQEGRRATTVDSAMQEDRCHPRKIFIGGLAHKTTTQQIREHFSRYGTIADAVVLRWSDGRSRGFGYVTFNDASSAAAALQEAHLVCGRQVDVKRAVPGTNKLFVGGLPQNTAAAELREHFEQFGSVSDAVVLMDPATGRSRGFGFVCFVPGQEGMAAVAASFENYESHRIRGKWIEVKSAVPPDKPADEERFCIQGEETPRMGPKHIGKKAMDAKSKDGKSMDATFGCTKSMDTQVVDPQCTNPPPFYLGKLPAPIPFPLDAAPILDDPQKVMLPGTQTISPLPAQIGFPPGLEPPRWEKQPQNATFEQGNAWPFHVPPVTAMQPPWPHCMPMQPALRAMPNFKAPSFPLPTRLAYDQNANGTEWDNFESVWDSVLTSGKDNLFMKEAVKEDLHKNLERLLKIETEERCKFKQMH